MSAQLLSGIAWWLMVGFAVLALLSLAEQWAARHGPSAPAGRPALTYFCAACAQAWLLVYCAVQIVWGHP